MYILSNNSTDSRYSVYPRGAKWELPEVPEGIILKPLTYLYRMEELEGFDKDKSTIHALILELMRRLGNTGDEWNRDLTTIQGILNTYKDNVYIKIKQLEQEGAYEAIRQGYEDRISELEDRIAVLESYIGS